MNGYQFIASIVQSLVSLAWPAALVFSVYKASGNATSTTIEI